LFVGPLLIRGLAALGRRAPISLRLALRDLARYQARSAAALGAISLALAIAATVAISAAAAAVPSAQANLARNEAVVSLSSDNGSAPREGSAPIPELSTDDVRALQTHVDALASSLHAQAVIGLTEAVDRTSPGNSADGTLPDDTVTLGRLTTVTRGDQRGIKVSGDIPLYVVTPALLTHYGISADSINPNTDIITGRSDLAGFDVIAPPGTTPCDSSQPECRVNGAKPSPGRAVDTGPDHWSPTVQTVKLPTDTSAPDTLLTMHALKEFGLKAVTAGWFIQTRSPLTTTQINAAQRAAAAAGVTIETRQKQASNAGLRDGATAVGLLVALGVLAMTVGLIRSETANELRTLTATGATSTTRRTITGATAGALALLGAVLGTGGAYVALIAWHRSDLHPLTQIPYVDLVIIIAGLPLLAIIAGWLLAGREPASIAHQPLE
jgi:putative ABC transport system permease protein